MAFSCSFSKSRWVYVTTRSQLPLMKKDREKTQRKKNNLHLGPANSFSPKRLLSILTNEQVVRKRRIQTKMFSNAKGKAPNDVYVKSSGFVII